MPFDHSSQKSWTYNDKTKYHKRQVEYDDRLSSLAVTHTPLVYHIKSIRTLGHRNQCYGTKNDIIPQIKYVCSIGYIAKNVIPILSSYVAPVVIIDMFPMPVLLCQEGITISKHIIETHGKSTPQFSIV